MLVRLYVVKHRFEIRTRRVHVANLLLQMKINVSSTRKILGQQAQESCSGLQFFRHAAQRLTLQGKTDCVQFFLDHEQQEVEICADASLEFVSTEIKAPFGSGRLNAI